MTTQTPRPALVTRSFLALLTASVGALSSFYLLLSVTPMRAVAGGATESSAGPVTATLMLAGVLAECASTSLMHRYGARVVLAAGLVLLGAPALLLVPVDDLPVVLGVCVARGLGFGLVVVASAALVVSVVPAARRGEGLGIFGVAACAPAVLALPLGVWLVERVGYGPVFALGAAAAGVAAPLALAVAPSGCAGADETQRAMSLRTVLRRGDQVRPAVVFGSTTLAAGALVAFLPLAHGVSPSLAATGLLLHALLATVGRWLAGRYVDRHGAQPLLVPAVVVAGIGMVALLDLGEPVLLLLGMAVFGGGFGVAQTATFALMVSRVDESGHGAVSALWNLSYDLGYGIGPAVFGMIVASTGYPWALALTGMVVLSAVLPALRDRAAGRTVPVAVPVEPIAA